MTSMRTRRSAWSAGAIAVAALVFVVAAAAGATGRTANVALAAPAAAPNDVTKWNAIAQSTILAQPPNASAPPAANVFMAMVQGSVYGAVNAIDRRHRPYLVMRMADPEASKEAAVATAAFRVLDALFPAQHVTLQAQYDSSLGAIPDGPLKEAGIEVGNAAAEAMLAEGHDGRLGPIPPLPPGWSGFLGAAVETGRHANPGSQPLGRARASVPGQELVAVPHGRSVCVHQCCLRRRLQRGQGARR